MSQITKAHANVTDHNIEQNSVQDAFDLMAALRNTWQISNLKVLLTLERSVVTSGPLHDVQRKVVQILPNLVLVNSNYEHDHFAP